MNIKELDEAATVIIVYKNGKVNVLHPAKIKNIIAGYIQSRIDEIFDEIYREGCEEEKK
jgi:ribosomal protein S17E